MFIKAGPAAAEPERRGSVSNWFSSLRRGGGRRKREETAVPSGYGSLGRRKDGSQPRGKTRSAWDLTTVTRLVCILSSIVFTLKVIIWWHTALETAFGWCPNMLDRSRSSRLRVKWWLNSIYFSLWRNIAFYSITLFFFCQNTQTSFWCSVSSIVLFFAQNTNIVFSFIDSTCVFASGIVR